MRRQTYFIDIDGTILEHLGEVTKMVSARDYEIKLCNGIYDFFNAMMLEDACIVLTTARKESMRHITEKQLARCGLFWDHLIMGLGSGPRIVINDIKPDCTEMAIGINLERNVGFGNI